MTDNLDLTREQAGLLIRIIADAKENEKYHKNNEENKRFLDRFSRDLVVYAASEKYTELPNVFLNSRDAVTAYLLLEMLDGVTTDFLEKLLLIKDKAPDSQKGQLVQVDGRYTYRWLGQDKLSVGDKVIVPPTWLDKIKGNHDPFEVEVTEINVPPYDGEISNIISRA